MKVTPFDKPHPKSNGTTDVVGTASTLASDSLNEPPTPSTSGTESSTSSSISPHYDDKKDVILHLEFLPDAAVKSVIGLLWMGIAVGVALLIVALVYKVDKPHDYFFHNNKLFITNIVFASGQVLILSLALTYLLRRIIRSNASGKRWSVRRKKSVTFATCELSLQLINSVLFLAPNAYVMAKDCAWFDSVTMWTGFGRWTIWNTLFFLFLVQTSSAGPITRRRWRSTVYRPDAIKLDLPIWVHWPKVLYLWLPMEGFLFGLFLESEIHRNTQPVQLPGQSCHDVKYDCSLTDAGLVLTNLIMACIVGYLCAYIFYVHRVFNHLRNRPYNKYRMGNIIIRLQARLRLLALFFFVITSIVYFYVDLNTCSSFMISWFGFLPMQFVMTVVSLCQATFIVPKKPSENNILMVWLQEFAWTEQDVPRKKEERASSLPAAHRICQCHATDKDGGPGGNNPFSKLTNLLPLPTPTAPSTTCIQCEPMFCFETAIKMMYWSFLTYDLDEGMVNGKRYSGDTAMSLFDLEHLEVVWEKSLDSKAVIGWNADTVIVAFRGTASMSNVLADLQAWRTRHPLGGVGFNMLQGVPMVHVGFLKAYTTNDFNEKLLNRVKSIVGHCCDMVQQKEGPGKKVKVYLTGHSLGGALAQLAGVDLMGRCPKSRSRFNVKIYTFGAPRVGNRAFANWFNALLPDTWQVINDDDLVVRAAKFIFMFKHAGKKVWINKKGDMVVRPSYIEIATRRLPGGGSVKDHLLVSYQRALLAVVAAQFGSKALGATEEVMGLAADAKTRAVLAAACKINAGGSHKKKGAPATQFCQLIQSPEGVLDLETQASETLKEEEFEGEPQLQEVIIEEPAVPGKEVTAERHGVCVHMKLASGKRKPKGGTQTVCQLLKAAKGYRGTGRAAARAAAPFADMERSKSSASTEVDVHEDEIDYTSSSLEVASSSGSEGLVDVSDTRGHIAESAPSLVFSLEPATP